LHHRWNVAHPSRHEYERYRCAGNDPAEVSAAAEDNDGQKDEGAVLFAQCGASGKESCQKVPFGECRRECE